jgi:Protein of unknown function (DUF3175)
VKKRKPSRRPTRRARWSQRVTETSNALDLELRVFQHRSARAIATSLKRSADRSRRRKSPPFQSAMSMLNFYVNRAGRALPAGRRRVLLRAKEELRRLYGRPRTEHVGRVRARATARRPAPARR